MRYILSLFYSSFIVFIFTTCHKHHLNQVDPWQKLTSPFGGQLMGIQFIDSDTGYILGLNTEVGNRYNAILRTTDKGNTWREQIFPEPEPGGVGRIFTYNSGLIFASKDGIFKSIDGGSSWIITDTNYNSVMNLTNGIYFFDPQNGLTIKGELIYKTTDGAKHFDEIYYDPSGSTLKELQFVSGSSGYIRGGNLQSNLGFLLKTSDKGNTWKNIPFNYGFLNTMFFINENIGYCLVTQDIYKTTDGGNTWVKKVIPSQASLAKDMCIAADSP